MATEQHVKRRVIRPDGTVSIEYFDPSQVLLRPQQPITQSINTTPAQVPPRPPLMLPQAGNFLSQVGEFVSKPENFGLLGQIANAIAPNTIGGNLGMIAHQGAQAQLFQQALKKPEEMSPMLNPELQSAVLNQTRQDQQLELARKQLALNMLLGKAELGFKETPEQRLNREAIITLLGQQPAAPKMHRVSINVDAQKKETTQPDKHIWVVDDMGNLIKYVGPDKQQAPADTGGQGLEAQRSELAEIKHAEDQAYELLSLKYPDKLVRDPKTGRWTLIGGITDEVMTDFSELLGQAIRAKQSRGVIRDPIDIPPLGSVSSIGVEQSKPVQNKKRKF